MKIFNKIKGLNQKLAYYPRLRVIIILLGLVLIAFIFVDLFSSKPNTTNAPRSSVQQQNVDLTTKRDVVKGGYAKLKHQSLVDQRNEDARSGRSFVDGVFSDGKPVKHDHKPVPKAPTKTQAHSENPVKFFQEQQKEEKEKAERQNRMEQESADQNITDENGAADGLEGRMQIYLSKVKKSWKLPVASSTQVSSDDSDSFGGSGFNGQSGSSLPQNVIIKAGDIMYAVMDTEVNSDIPGPIMATIVTGQFKGAKLLGSFTRPQNGDKLVVQFNRMSMKDAPSTISINAYAVDAVTAQSALADDVNHHYLFRYGSLLAGAFLEGFGNAYAATNICPPGTKCYFFGNQHRPTTTTKTAAYQGLGQVGTKIGDQWKNNFDIPPTIKIHQGTGLGILYMDDVTPSGSASTGSSTTPAGSKPTAVPGSDTTAAVEKIMSGSTQNALTDSIGSATSKLSGGS